jgi:hypothetical protein
MVERYLIIQGIDHGLTFIVWNVEDGGGISIDQSYLEWLVLIQRQSRQERQSNFIRTRIDQDLGLEIPKPKVSYSYSYSYSELVIRTHDS